MNPLPNLSSESNFFLLIIKKEKRKKNEWEKVAIDDVLHSYEITSSML